MLPCLTRRASWRGTPRQAYARPMTPHRYRRVLEVLARRQPDLTVLAEAVHKPHNLSAVLRSCDAVGVPVVHAVRGRGPVPTFSATSASADKWVELRVHDDLDLAIDGLRAQGMQVLAAHLSEGAVDFREPDYTKPTCLLFGNEKDGVSPRAASVADHHIKVPMLGMVQSLNVSVAAAVILFEAQRQRRAAGYYGAPRLPEAVRRELAVRWLHPREVAMLEERGLPLPDLTADGELPPEVMARLSRSHEGAS